MTGRVYMDFETKSHADLKTVGAWEYSLDKSTEVIVLCWRIRHEGHPSFPVKYWTPKSHPINCPGDLREAIEDGYEIEAHNYSFEVAIWQNVMVSGFGWPAVKASQWRDTMAVACYYAMPAKLDALLRALHMPPKNPEGGRLISRYSKLYLKTSSSTIPPDDMSKWIQYCKEDVLREEQVSDYLGDLPDRELPIFLLDGEINRRGITLDQQGVQAASLVVEKRAAELIEAFRRITNLNPTQGAKIIEWAHLHGVELENMQAAYLEDRLEESEDDPIPAGIVRDALRIRLKHSKASTKKLASMAAQSSSDGIARWQQRYHGAQTGRQTGAGIQVLNLKKGWEDVDPEQLVRDIMHGDPAWLDAVYGDAMDAVSRASRHWITASPGHQIYAGDFVSIEAVICAVLAGEEWLVQAFRDGVKIYELEADKVHGFPPGTVTKATHPNERQDGKTCSLAFQYQGALNAWLKFDDSGRHTDERIIEMCKAWRKAHPMIVQFWKDLEDAAIEAIKVPGNTTWAGVDGTIQFQIVDEWLSMILPNGKRIWYREPELKMKMPAWHRPATKEDCRAGACSCRPQPSLVYKAQKEGQWREVSTYGGKLAENACQAVSREYLIPSMMAVREAGYPIILSVYDEVVCDVPNGHGSKEEFEHLLANAPGRDWAAGWPIRVDGWVGRRYKK